jgi:hypothetical protein
MLSKLLPIALLVGSLNVSAQRRSTINFKHTYPDVIMQMNFQHYHTSFLMNRMKDAFAAVKGKDLYDQMLRLPEFKAYKHDKGIADHIVGDLGQAIAQAINIELKGATTTINAYDFFYKIGKPRLFMTFKDAKDGKVILNAKASTTRIEIGVDNLYVNNNSKGVTVERSYYSDGQKRTRVLNPHLRTLLDDIYLKIANPTDDALLVIDGGFGRRNNPEAVLSADMDIEISAEEDGTLKAQLLRYDVGLFGAKEAKDFAPFVKLKLGKGTKIGGGDATEIGMAEFKLYSPRIAGIVEEQKVALAEIIAGPVIEQIANPEIKASVNEAIAKLSIKPDFEKEFKDLNIGVRARAAEFGSVKSNSIPKMTMYNKKYEQNQLRVGLDIDIYDPKDRSYVWKRPYNEVYRSNQRHKLLLSNKDIYDEIASDRNSLVLSFDQEFINQAINVYVKDRSKELLGDAVPASVSIGDQGVFLMLDDREQGKVNIHIKNREPKLFLRSVMTAATGRKFLEFPLIMSPEITFDMVKDVPTLKVVAKKIELSVESLKNPPYGLKSNMDKGWLKKVVLNQITNMLGDMEGETLAEIPLTQLKGLPLNEILEIRSNGYGRLNVLVDISPFSRKSQKFFKALPEVLKNLMQENEQSRLN